MVGQDLQGAILRMRKPTVYIVSLKRLYCWVFTGGHQTELRRQTFEAVVSWRSLAVEGVWIPTKSSALKTKFLSFPFQTAKVLLYDCWPFPLQNPQTSNTCCSPAEPLSVDQTPRWDEPTWFLSQGAVGRSQQPLSAYREEGPKLRFHQKRPMGAVSSTLLLTCLMNISKPRKGE